MASEAPDPQNLKSWEDAFQFPIPTVRRLEQELRRDLASSRERLRTLVSTRYRELLGTAEAIVSMNRDIQEVESKLADVGRRCNPRLIEAKSSRYYQMKKEGLDEDADRRSFAAQLALLYRCATTISKLLRKKGSPLLVAKLLVVCRLLLKTLLQRPEKPPFLENLRGQLVLLRRSLLKRVDKRFSLATTGADDLLENLAAYCLVTSSSSDDVIRHFYQIRLDGVTRLLEMSDSGGENVLQALKLYSRTLRNSKSLLSRSLADILGKITSCPVLTDNEIRALDELEFDVLGPWIPADVGNFTPWIKVTEYTKTEAEDLIKQWSRQALDLFVKGCKATLSTWIDLPELLLLRRKTLEVWLTSKSSEFTHSSLDVLDSIRKVFNKQLSKILSDQAKSLETVGQNVSSMIATWDEAEHASMQSLWESDMIGLEYSNGAAAFKRAITDRLLGQDKDVWAVLQSYQSWSAAIQTSKDQIDNFQRVKWLAIADDLADDDNADADIISILNDDDPRLLLQSFKVSVENCFVNLQSLFNDAFKSLGSTNLSSKAAFMLRLIKQIRRNIPRGFDIDNYAFSKDIVLDLQEILAAEVTSQVGPFQFQMYSTNKDGSLGGRTLWEGEPPLPGQPSLAVFQFLRKVTDCMQQCGQDLWDPSTTSVLKSALCRQLVGSISVIYKDFNEAHRAWAKHEVDAAEHTLKNGNSEEEREDPNKDGETAEKGQPPHGTENNLNQDVQLQLLFDVIYLQNALTATSIQQTDLIALAGEVQSKLGQNKEIATTLKKNAEEYWERTRLLFGLLLLDWEMEDYRQAGA